MFTSQVSSVYVHELGDECVLTHTQIFCEHIWRVFGKLQESGLSLRTDGSWVSYGLDTLAGGVGELLAWLRGRGKSWPPIFCCTFKTPIMSCVSVKLLVGVMFVGADTWDTCFFLWLNIKLNG